MMSHCVSQFWVLPLPTATQKIEVLGESTHDSILSPPAAQMKSVPGQGGGIKYMTVISGTSL